MGGYDLEGEEEVTTVEMVIRLREMDRQIIHGTDMFRQIANRLEALNSFCYEVAEDSDDRVSPGLKNKARLIKLLDK